MQLQIVLSTRMNSDRLSISCMDGHTYCAYIMHTCFKYYSYPTFSINFALVLWDQSQWAGYDLNKDSAITNHYKH